jgi:hypothetical protein
MKGRHPLLLISRYQYFFSFNFCCVCSSVVQASFDRFLTVFRYRARGYGEVEDNKRKIAEGATYRLRKSQSGYIGRDYPFYPIFHLFRASPSIYLPISRHPVYFPIRKSTPLEKKSFSQNINVKRRQKERRDRTRRSC